VKTPRIPNALNIGTNNYEGVLTFGTNATWCTGISQHDDGHAEMRIWAKHSSGHIYLVTGYDGSNPAALTLPQAGLTVGHSNYVGIGNFGGTHDCANFTSGTNPKRMLHVRGDTLLQCCVWIGATDTYHSTGDNTPVVGSNTTVKLTVDGSIHLLSNNDAYFTGRGTGSFFKDEEIGFGWGGGWYQTEGTKLCLRGGKILHSTGLICSTTTVQSPVICGTTAVRGTDICATSWFRNDGSGEGLYNTVNDNHFYSSSPNYWHINSKSACVHGGLIFYSQHQPSPGHATGRRGYIYWDGTNNFGLLTCAGSWGLKLVGNTSVYLCKPTCVVGALTGSTTICATTCLCSPVVCAITSVKAAYVCSTGNMCHQGLTLSTGTDIDQYFQCSASLTLTTAWLNTGVQGSSLATGTYIVKMFVNNYATSGGAQYSVTYSGIMSWITSGTNDASFTSEIPLHAVGHAANAQRIFLRTCVTASGIAYLQMATTVNTGGSSSYDMCFRRMM